MPMNNRLLRPRAGGVHPEAAAWRTAVVANGGSVSGSTLSAVDKFCKAIDAAGIRDRFYRLNLFCGTGLNAALVPLYRGQSLGGARYGNTTDTNTNFVSGDYTETGSSGGLNTQGSFTRYLSLGTDFPADDSSLHMATYDRLRSGQTTINGWGMQVVGGGGSRIQNRGTSTGRAWIGGQFWGGDYFPTGTIAATTFVIASRISASNMFVRFNGVANGGDTTARTLVAPNIGSVSVFGSVGGGNYHDGILAAYSYGLGLTTSQADAYNTAMQAFQTALGRQV